MHKKSIRSHYSKRLSNTIRAKTKAEMLNKKASESKNKPDEIIKTLELRQGQKVADIGTGGGYLALKFTQIVGNNGQVFATDINDGFPELVKNKAKENNINNITAILIQNDKTNFPRESIDLIFMRNVYHHLTNRKKFVKQFEEVLKNNGK